MESELELGGFYTCETDEFDPVVIWIGRVDLPEDLPEGLGGAAEPVISVMIKAPASDAPTISHAPFWESNALDVELMDADPFYVDHELFDETYNIWRDAFDRAEAYPWTMTPNEVYARMMADLTGAEPE